MFTILARLAMVLGLAGAVGGDFGYQDVKPQVYDSEAKSIPDIWGLNFTFRTPRFIMADIPGEGRKLIWYMTYKVVNRTEKPRTLIPQFTLVGNDNKVYQDVILPRAEKAVIAREDPTQNLLNSVTISADPIPVSAPDGASVVRSGVAFWEGVDMNTKSFTIYVTGLSNGYVKVTDEKTGKTEIRRKTLKLEFIKPGDIYNPNEKEIRFVGEPQWVYR